jgi:hypothetical protein
MIAPVSHHRASVDEVALAVGADRIVARIGRDLFVDFDGERRARHAGCEHGAGVICREHLDGHGPIEARVAGAASARLHCPAMNMQTLSNACLMALVFFYSLNLAPMMFETFTSDRTWASSPPDSFHMFQGPYGHKTAHYWRVVSPLAS